MGYRSVWDSWYLGFWYRRENIPKGIFEDMGFPKSGFWYRWENSVPVKPLVYLHWVSQLSLHELTVYIHQWNRLSIDLQVGIFLYFTQQSIIVLSSSFIQSCIVKYCAQLDISWSVLLSLIHFFKYVKLVFFSESVLGFDFFPESESGFDDGAAVFPAVVWIEISETDWNICFLVWIQLHTQFKSQNQPLAQNSVMVIGTCVTEK